MNGALAPLLDRAKTRGALVPNHETEKRAFSVHRTLDTGGMVVARIAPWESGHATSRTLSTWLVESLRSLANTRATFRPVLAYFEHIETACGESPGILRSLADLLAEGPLSSVGCVFGQHNLRARYAPVERLLTDNTHTAFTGPDLYLDFDGKPIVKGGQPTDRRATRSSATRPMATHVLTRPPRTRFFRILHPWPILRVRKAGHETSTIGRRYRP